MTKGTTRLMTKMRTILALSIVLNVFLIGALGGGAAWLNYGSRMIAAGSLRVAGSELPADQARAFRKVLRQARAGANEHVQQSRRARANAAELLKAPDVDQTAVKDTLEEGREADFRVRAAVEDAAVQFAATLPLEQRTQLANAIAERNLHRGRRNR